MVTVVTRNLFQFHALTHLPLANVFLGEKSTAVILFTARDLQRSRSQSNIRKLFGKFRIQSFITFSLVTTGRRLRLFPPRYAMMFSFDDLLTVKCQVHEDEVMRWGNLCLYVMSQRARCFVTIIPPQSSWQSPLTTKRSEAVPFRVWRWESSAWLERGLVVARGKLTEQCQPGSQIRIILRLFFSNRLLFCFRSNLSLSLSLYTKQDSSSSFELHLAFVVWPCNCQTEGSSSSTSSSSRSSSVTWNFLLCFCNNFSGRDQLSPVQTWELYLYLLF